MTEQYVKPGKRDRFGQPQQVQVRGISRVCTLCQTVIESAEIPAGFLDDPYWGDYECGDCAAVSRPA